MCERLSTQTFDRLSDDRSGFGPAHRDGSDSSDSRDNGRESCTTTGFDFYVGKLGTMQNAMINREKELFSPPFKTRAEKAA